MSNYSIKDLERLTGIKAHTIRIWEKRFKLIEPGRSDTNIRSYCDTDLKRLLNISVLNRNGLKISKIAQLSGGEITNLVNKLTEDPHDSESQFESLYMSMIDLDEELFDKIITRSIIQMGFEQMVVKILYPFLRRIGIMWQTGAVSPAQEHFMSNLIRQKVIVAIDSLVNEQKDNAKSFILYLPDKELHELGLLFMYYILKKRGQKVIYLGSILPFESLLAVEKLKLSDYLVTSFVATIELTELNEYVQRLNNETITKNIFIIGQQAEKTQIKSDKLKILPTIESFIEQIDQIIL